MPINDLFDVIREVILTDKSYSSMSLRKYTFKVAKDSNKQIIKKAIESVFKVKVSKVNVINCKPVNIVFKGRRGVESGFKKAVVTLEEGFSIDLI